jgi:uncharacterized protein (UPF0147 family)
MDGWVNEMRQATTLAMRNRIIAALREIANDEHMPQRKRREATRKADALARSRI